MPYSCTVIREPRGRGLMPAVSTRGALRAATNRAAGAASRRPPAEAGVMKLPPTPDGKVWYTRLDGSHVQLTPAQRAAEAEANARREQVQQTMRKRPCRGAVSASAASAARPRLVCEPTGARRADAHADPSAVEPSVDSDADVSVEPIERTDRAVWPPSWSSVELSRASLNSPELLPELSGAFPGARGLFPASPSISRA